MLAQSLAVRLVYNVLSTVLAAGTLDLGAMQMLAERNLENVMLLHQTGHMFHLRCSHAAPPSIYQFNSSKERLALKCILERYLPFIIFLCKESTHLCHDGCQNAILSGIMPRYNSATSRRSLG